MSRGIPASGGGQNRPANPPIRIHPPQRPFQTPKHQPIILIYISYSEIIDLGNQTHLGNAGLQSRQSAFSSKPPKTFPHPIRDILAFWLCRAMNHGSPQIQKHFLCPKCSLRAQKTVYRLGSENGILYAEPSYWNLIGIIFAKIVESKFLNICPAPYRSNRSMARDTSSEHAEPSLHIREEATFT